MQQLWAGLRSTFNEFSTDKGVKQGCCSDGVRRLQGRRPLVRNSGVRLGKASDLDPGGPGWSPGSATVLLCDLGSSLELSSPFLHLQNGDGVVCWEG